MIFNGFLANMSNERHKVSWVSFTISIHLRLVLGLVSSLENILKAIRCRTMALSLSYLIYIYQSQHTIMVCPISRNIQYTCVPNYACLPDL